MPSASLAPGVSPERPERPERRGRPGDRWRPAGLALLALWSAVFALAVVLWVRVAFFAGATDDPHGYLALFGAPFALLAAGLLWWAWWSARALQQGRREGWTLLLVLGGVAVAQSVMTAPAVVGALGTAGTTAGTSGDSRAGAGPPPEMVTGMLVAITLGLLSVVVAVVARRRWGAADAEAVEPAEGSTPAPGRVTDPQVTDRSLWS